MFDVFIMDMGGHDENVQQILSKLPHAQSMRYMSTHLEMVKRAAKRSRTEYFWLVASCCNYEDFSFDYLPPPWEAEQIHCWASGDQKFGDTFLINVAAWQKQEKVEKLEWYNHINYHADGVERLDWPRVAVDDNLTQAILDHKFESLYVDFYINTTNGKTGYNMSLWENRDIIAFNKTGHVSLCPRDAKQAIKEQIYDWHYIKYVKDEKISEKTQDIVFISYDEENADIHWNKLYEKYPRAKRSHGVKGLENALKSAAALATSPYFYAVFAKTEIVDSFDFSFQPDHLKNRSNFVFQAYNPVLNHSYGHGAVVLHNRQWLLNNSIEIGADITMSIPVVSVPILSCINHYNETPWSAYRTAFREVYKLKKMSRIEDEYHLHLWLTSNHQLNGNWSQLGATDAMTIDDFNINDWDKIRNRFESYNKQ